jgi:hypothetical protein
MSGAEAEGEILPLEEDAQSEGWIMRSEQK